MSTNCQLVTLCFGLLFAFTCRGDNSERKLTLMINPCCNATDECNKTANLVYIRADGEEDSLHYLWSTFGAFSMLLARTSKESELTIDWDKFLGEDSSESVNFIPAPMYTSVVFLSRLYNYDDIHDKVDMKQADNITTYEFTSFTWENVTYDNSSTREISVTFNVQDIINQTYEKNSLQFILTAFGYKGHAKRLPRLMHTSESFQMEMVLSDFKTNYSSPRFALEAAFISDRGDEDFISKTYRTIDDEYTPGVFKTFQLTSPYNQSSNQRAYIQFKPVCYTASSRTTEYSTDIKEELISVNTSDHSELYKNLAFAYYGSNITDMPTQWMDLLFGLHGDEFYQGYISWTTTIGIGEAPSESFSTMVIVIIIVGFGIPALLIIIGGIIILVRRLKHKDDDLQFGNTRLIEES